MKTVERHARYGGSFGAGSGCAGVGGPRNAQAHAEYLVESASDVVQQGFEAFGDVGHQVVGADTDLLIDIGHCQDLAGQVADTQLGAASADRGREHNPGVGVEDQPRGWSASGRWRFCALGTRPRACSVETRAATALRDSPVMRPTSARW